MVDGSSVRIDTIMLDNLYRALELIRGVLPYSEYELLKKHEKEFYKILLRSEKMQRQKIKSNG